MRTRNMVSASNLRPFHAKVKSSRQKFRSLQRGPLYVLQEISFGNISGVTQMHCDLVWLETIVPSCPTKADKQLLCLMPRISSTYGARAKGCRQKRRFGPRRRWGEVPGGDCQIRLEDLVQIVFARAEVRHDLVHLQYDRSVMKAAPYCFPDWVVHRSAVDVISFFYVSNRSFH